MRTVQCVHCGQTWSALPDGTVIEHPLPDHIFLLCPGSRTRSRTDSDKPEKRRAPARRVKPALALNGQRTA
jgi:hypothetical protein